MSVFKWSEALRSVKKEVRPGEALPALLWRFSTWFSVPDSKQPTYASSKENTDSYRKILLNSMQKKKLQKYQHSDIFTCKSLISRRLSAGCTKALSPGILVPSASRYQPTHLTFYHNCTSLMPVSLWGAGEGWHWKSPPSLPPSLIHRDSTMCTLADAEAHHSTLKPC